MRDETRRCLEERYCSAKACNDGKSPRCRYYRPAKRYKAFGWDVTVRFADGHEEMYHWRGCTEADARRKGLLKSHAREIVRVEALDEETWIRAYGIGSM